eukprot:14954024-Alexandrium_andersonii.AAC.1
MHKCTGELKHGRARRWTDITARARTDARRSTQHRPTSASKGPALAVPLHTSSTPVSAMKVRA